jgi:hypothetical protein
LAVLTGAQEVPPVETDGIGFSFVLPVVRGHVLFYSLSVFGLPVEDVQQSHIHIGPAGENGPVVAFLYEAGDDIPRACQSRPVPCLARGALTAADLVGPLAGQPMTALAEEIAAGNAYVNVHTVAVPSGEIRGQLTGIAGAVLD